MKRKFFWIILASGIYILALSALVIRWSMIRPDDPGYERLTTYERSLIRPGDVILRQGFGWMSILITDALNEQPVVSHCGILVVKNGKTGVIHSISKAFSEHDGMQYDDLDTFLRDSRPNSLVVTRYLKINRETEIKMQLLALNYLNDRIPFDHAFELEDTTSFYCNELIRRIFIHAAGFDPYPGTSLSAREQVTFRVLTDPAQFKTIINHQKSDHHSLTR